MLNIYAVLHIQNIHTYKNALEYLRNRGFNLDNVILIKAGEFEIEESWKNYLELCTEKRNFLNYLSKKSGYLKRIIQIHRSKLAAKRANRLITGEIEFICAHYSHETVRICFQNITNDKKMVLIDDGMMVFSTIELRNKVFKPEIEPEKKNKKSNRKLKDLLTKFVFNLLGLKNTHPDNVVYYSKFPIEEKISSRDIYINQPLYDWSGCSVDNNFVHIVGQPLVTLGIISEAKFKSILNSVVNKYKNKFHISYIRHPRESIKEEKIVNSIDEIDVCELDTRYEDFILGAKVLPGQIITFYSSVLYTMYNANQAVNFYFISIDESDLICDYKTSLNIIEIYNILSSDAKISEWFTVNSNVGKHQKKYKI